VAKKSEIKKAKILYFLGVFLIIGINLAHFGYQKNIKKNYLQNLEGIFSQSIKSISAQELEEKLPNSLGSEKQYFKDLGTKANKYLEATKKVESLKKHQSAQEVMIDYYTDIIFIAGRYEEVSQYLEKMAEVGLALKRIDTSLNNPRAYLLEQQSHLRAQLITVKEVTPPKIFENYHTDLIEAITSFDLALEELISAISARNSQLIAAASNKLEKVSLPESGPSYRDLSEYIMPKKDKEQLKIQEGIILKKLSTN
jgi:predicted nuclease with TOPRIM domain